MKCRTRDGLSEIVLIVLRKYWVFIFKFGADKLVDGYHELWELCQEIYHEGLVGVTQQLLDFVGQLMVVVLLVPDESEQVCEQLSVVLPELFELIDQTRVKLPGPTELTNILVFLSNLVQAHYQLLS